MADVPFTTSPIHMPRLSRLRDAVDGFFARLMDTSARVAEIDRLNAKSDAELARLGLRREDIPRHVFRDLIGF